MHIQSTFRAPAGTARLADVPDTGNLLNGMHPAAITLFAADSTIYNVGDAAGPLYFVEFGTVRVCRLTADGRRQIVAFHVAGDVFGFEAGAEHDSYAESVEGSGVRVLRTNAGHEPTSNLLLLALKSLSRAQGHLIVLGRLTANERVASLLLDLAERQGDDRRVKLAMPRNDIADYLGLTFETVSRILRIFKDQGLIRLHAIGDIEILNPEALSDLCQ